MQFWAIIKMIAGIIANLPFDASAQEVQAVVESSVSVAQDEVAVNNTGISQDQWNELSKIVSQLTIWLLRNVSK